MGILSYYSFLGLRLRGRCWWRRLRRCSARSLLGLLFLVFCSRHSFGRSGLLACCGRCCCYSRCPQLFPEHFLPASSLQLIVYLLDIQVIIVCNNVHKTPDLLLIYSPRRSRYEGGLGQLICFS